MGDRTNVELTVLKEQATRAVELIGENPETEDEYGEFTILAFQEVNYGNLPNRDLLQQEGIAYDSTWGAGGDYTAGTETCRFTSEGEPQVKEVYEIAENPSLHKLMELRSDPIALVKYIEAFHEEVTPLPWAYQIEYGKLYRTRQLINV